MRNLIRLAMKILIALLGLTVLEFGIALAMLILPGQPDASQWLHFDGFIELPTGRSANVLDYMTEVDDDLFVASASSGRVFKISLGIDTRWKNSPPLSLAGPHRPHGVAIAPNGVAFVSGSAANVVDAFDSINMQLLGSIPVANGADAIISLPSLNQIYVASGELRKAMLIDANARTKIAEIPLPGRPEFAVWDETTGLVYQNLSDANALIAIDPVKGHVVGQWPLPSCARPTGLAIDTVGRRLFSVCNRNARLVVLDLDTHRAVASEPSGGKPDTLAFDPELHRIYTSGAEGTLTIIMQNDASTYAVLENLRIHFGAHTLAVDPRSHKLLVGYDSLLVAPRVAVFSPMVTTSSM